MASLCHPWFTTTNLSYRFPIFETSATALCGTTGIYIYILYIYICIIYIYIYVFYIYIYIHVLYICVYLYLVSHLQYLLFLGLLKKTNVFWKNSFFFNSVFLHTSISWKWLLQPTKLLPLPSTHFSHTSSIWSTRNLSKRRNSQSSSAQVSATWPSVWIPVVINGILARLHLRQADNCNS